MKINKGVFHNQLLVCGKELQEMLRLLLPQNRKEILVLLFFFGLYFSYSIYIGLTSSLLDCSVVLVDRYFSFDNPYIFEFGSRSFASHPFFFGITYPIVYVCNLLVLIFHTIKIKTVIVTFICCSLISSTNVFVYRYLFNVLEMKRVESCLITLFYGLFSTNLILCFTFESFTFSSYILSFAVYYYSLKIKENKKISLFASFIISFSLVGVTITNFFKGIIPLCISKEDKKDILKKIGIICCALACVFLIIELTWGLASRINTHYSAFSEVKSLTFGKTILSFFGSPILFPEIEVIPYMYHPLDRFVMILGDYQHVWQCLFVSIVLALITLSFFINRKTKLVQMIFLLLSVDIVIHFIFKFGLEDPFIYGGHWVYIVPLLLGWLYKSIENYSKIAKCFWGTISVLLIVLLINNLNSMIQFIDLSSKLFPLE